MRTSLMTPAVVLGLALAAPAWAQTTGAQTTAPRSVPLRPGATPRMAANGGQAGATTGSEVGGIQLLPNANEKTPSTHPERIAPAAPPTTVPGATENTPGSHAAVVAPTVTEPTAPSRSARRRRGEHVAHAGRMAPYRHGQSARHRHFARYRHGAPARRLIREGAMNPATGARWGHEPGVGESLPFSTHASNIIPQDTRSIIAPSLPVPPTQDASTDQFLRWARHAVARRRTGLAQSNLERAMTARLNGDEARGQSPTADPTIGVIQQALRELARRHYAGVDRRIAEAMSDARMAYGTPAPGYRTEYGMNAGAAGAPGTSNFTHRFNGEDMNPIQQPPHRAMPGTLGSEVSPPGTRMNPTGSPGY